MSDKETIYQLFASDKANIQLGLQLLKGQPELKAAVEAEVLPILASANKKTLRGLPKFLADFKKHLPKMLQHKLPEGWESLPFIQPQLAAIQQLELKDSPSIGLSEALIASLQRASYVILIRQGLQQLPTALSTLPNLQRLWLLDNQLVHLPDNMGPFPSLRDLYLQNNQLVELPASIGALPALKNLYLTNNRLTHLPDSISQLKGLEALMLENNRLKTLPDSIGQLTNLHIVDLSDNQIQHLPEHLEGLEQLYSLNLKNNPIHPTDLDRIKEMLPQCAIRF